MVFNRVIRQSLLGILLALAAVLCAVNVPLARAMTSDAATSTYNQPSMDGTNPGPTGTSTLPPGSPPQYDPNNTAAMEVWRSQMKTYYHAYTPAAPAATPPATPPASPVAAAPNAPAQQTTASSQSASSLANGGAQQPPVVQTADDTNTPAQPESQPAVNAVSTAEQKPQTPQRMQQSKSNPKRIKIVLLAIALAAVLLVLIWRGKWIKELLRSTSKRTASVWRKTGRKLGSFWPAAPVAASTQSEEPIIAFEAVEQMLSEIPSYPPPIGELSDMSSIFDETTVPDYAKPSFTNPHARLLVPADNLLAGKLVPPLQLISPGRNELVDSEALQSFHSTRSFAPAIQNRVYY